MSDWIRVCFPPRPWVDVGDRPSYPIPRMSVHRSLCVGLLLLVFACAEERGDISSAPRSPQARAAPSLAAGAEESTPNAQLVAARGASNSEKAARAPGERALPSFAGRTLAGTRLSMSSLIGKRTLLFFFNPELEDAGPVADAVADVAGLAKSNNFQVLGIGVGSNSAKLRSFVKQHGFDFPVIDDSNANIANVLRIPGPLFIIGADSEGYMSFVLPGFDASGEDPEKRIAEQIKESLRIRSGHVATRPLIDHPKAPSFTTTTIDGKPFDLASLKGRPIVLMFFLHTCPHCHAALEFFREQLEKIPEAKRPDLVGISLQNRPSAVRRTLDDENLDFFVPLMDPGQEILQSYGVSGGVPDISLINAEGEIIYRSNGWRDERDPPLMRMYLARIAGERVPMLLSKKGYAGNDVCAVCHEQQAATWEITQHAGAYGTLVTHGEER
ncbi:MAG: redoxin domain-containing protein, partial [Myxococcota bacterium]